MQQWCLEDAQICWKLASSLNQHQIEAEKYLRAEIDQIDFCCLSRSEGAAFHDLELHVIKLGIENHIV